jgi:F-type H+-transporting ATPase subunit a
MDLLPERIEHLIHELTVLPWYDMYYEGIVTPLTISNYGAWLMIAVIVVATMFVMVARHQSRRMALATESGNVTDLAPTNKFVSMIEMGVEFIRNMATDVIGPKDGPRFTALLGTFFFLILVSNFIGLIPGGKSIAGSIGGTAALALISWLAFVYVGFTKNGFIGYFKSLIPSGVRKMSLGGRIVLGGYLFLLEFLSTFLIRPLTLAVRLFANIYAGHIVLGIFTAFTFLFLPLFEDRLTASVGGLGVGLVSMLFLIIMYAFEIFVAFIQAYVFTILTAVYIQSSVHASEH